MLPLKLIIPFCSASACPKFCNILIIYLLHTLSYNKSSFALESCHSVWSQFSVCSLIPYRYYFALRWRIPSLKFPSSLNCLSVKIASEPWIRKSNNLTKQGPDYMLDVVLRWMQKVCFLLTNAEDFSQHNGIHLL